MIVDINKTLYFKVEEKKQVKIIYNNRVYFFTKGVYKLDLRAGDSITIPPTLNVIDINEYNRLKNPQPKIEPKETLTSEPIKEEPKEKEIKEEPKKKTTKRKRRVKSE